MRIVRCEVNGGEEVASEEEKDGCEQSNLYSRLGVEMGENKTWNCSVASLPQFTWSSPGVLLLMLRGIFCHSS